MWNVLGWAWQGARAQLTHALDVQRVHNRAFVLVARDGPFKCLLLHDLVAFLVFHFGILVMGLHLHHLGREVGQGKEGKKGRGINAQTKLWAESSQEAGMSQLPMVSPALGSVNAEAKPPGAAKHYQRSAGHASPPALSSCISKPDLTLWPTQGCHEGSMRRPMHELLINFSSIIKTQHPIRGAHAQLQGSYWNQSRPRHP